MLAQVSAEDVAHLVRLSIADEDAVKNGVPEHFRTGVLSGFLTAIDDAVKGLKGDNSPRVARIVDALEVVRSIFPEVQ